MPSEDLLENLIDKIAEAVVRKIDERQKIDLIAQAVLARLEERRGKGGEQSSGDGEANPLEVNRLSSRASRDNKSKRTTSQRRKKVR